MVVVHPAGHFTTARTDKQWQDACFWTLLAHCNHGDVCKNTFTDADQLETFSFEQVHALTEFFVMASAQDRLEQRLAPCPPHVRKAWHLGMAKRARAEQRKLSCAQVTSSMQQVKYVFTEEATWGTKLWTDMNAEEQVSAEDAWKKAEYQEGEAARNEVDEDKLCNLEEDQNVRKRMVVYMQKQLKWTHRELHDALIIAGLSAPGSPSFANYLTTLHAQFGDADNGFLPQCFQSHTKARIQEILRCLSRTGAKLGGAKQADSKAVLAQRLAHWLNQIIEAGRSKPAASDGEEEEEGEERNAASADSDGDLQKRKKAQNLFLTLAVWVKCLRMRWSPQSKPKALLAGIWRRSLMPTSQRRLTMIKEKRKKRWWAGS